MFIPIIFLTAKDELADKWKGLFMGAFGYITKPFPATKIGREVRQRLAKLQEKK